MNVSGPAVAAEAERAGLRPDEVLVVCDCLDLPLGRIRLRPGGSSGGHRGLESVLAALGTAHVPRLRIGIGREDGTAVVDYVLSRWAAAERPLLDEVLATAVQALLCAAMDGVDTSMNRFNGWRAAGASPTPAQPGGASDT
jgi:PTH1 family peptidyl-tRNA hydrolase